MTISSPHLKRSSAQVLDLEKLSANGYLLKLERGAIDFKAGQLITLHGPTTLDDRSYTICSGEHDDSLHVLFRYISTGQLTPLLLQLKKGDRIDITAPYGEFVLRDVTRPIVFIATGTGIAPCRAYVRTHPNLNFTIIHGVRQPEDLFFQEEFTRYAYHPCVSKAETAGFKGRVTDFCKQVHFDKQAHFYLCGANEMFYEMRDVLLQKGIPMSSIFTEAYYYRADD